MIQFEVKRIPKIIIEYLDRKREKERKREKRREKERKGEKRREKERKESCATSGRWGPFM